MGRWIWLALTAVFLITSLAASPAEAQAAGSNLRLKVLRAQAAAPPVDPETPPGADQTIQLHPTDNQFADLSATLAAMPDDVITVTVAGPAKFCVWQKDCQVAADGARTYARRNLLDGFLSVQTAAATPGAPATWTIATTGFSKVIAFDIQTSFTTYATTLGKQTPALFGGFDLGRLPGLAANKTISADPSNCFGIANGQSLTWKSTGGAYSATTPPTRACASPTGPNTVTIADGTLGQSWNIVFTHPDREWNFTSGPTDTFSIGQLNYLLARPLVCGDQVVGDGFGRNLVGNVATLSTTAPTGDCPTKPYGVGVDATDLMADGFFPDDSYDDGWIHVHGRYPARDGGGMAINNNGTSNRWVAAPFARATLPLYLRFSNFRGAPEPRFATSPSVPLGGYEWVMLDHLVVNGYAGSNAAISTLQTTGGTAGGGDRSAYVFVLHNDIDGEGLRTAAIHNFARRSQVVGNKMRRQGEDITFPGMYDEATAGVCPPAMSLFAFNFATDKHHASGAHPDGEQFNPNPNDTVGAIDNSPLYLAAASGTKFCMAPQIGNIFVNGTSNLVTPEMVGTSFNSAIVLAGDVGRTMPGSQLIFNDGGGTRTDAEHRWIVAGFFGQTATVHGIELAEPSDDSILGNNTITGDHAAFYALDQGGTALGYYSNGIYGIAHGGGASVNGIGSPAAGFFCQSPVSPPTTYCTPPAGIEIYNNAWLGGYADFIAAGATKTNNVLETICPDVRADACAIAPQNSTKIATYFVNPFLGAGATTPEAVEAAFSPVPVTSPLLQYYAATCKVAGAFGDKAMLDIAKQRWGAKLFLKTAC